MFEMLVITAVLLDPGGRAENAASGIKGSGCPDNRCRIRNYMKILTIQQEHP